MLTYCSHRDLHMVAKNVDRLFASIVAVELHVWTVKSLLFTLNPGLSAFVREGWIRRCSFRGVMTLLREHQMHLEPIDVPKTSFAASGEHHEWNLLSRPLLNEFPHRRTTEVKSSKIGGGLRLRLCMWRSQSSSPKH
mmetsp:Transcript_6620/g.20129  ORF Transcript_6620/g.20129 Transcript_6620/m.20129 type:complete len:137 (+) Transcript_6620:390-800(+)